MTSHKVELSKQDSSSISEKKKSTHSNKRICCDTVLFIELTVVRDWVPSQQFKWFTALGVNPIPSSYVYRYITFMLEIIIARAEKPTFMSFTLLY